MKRRAFIKVAAGVSSGLLLPSVYSKQKYDVIVLGAGLAGLSAAYTLSKQGANVLILEASDRTGGRVKTLNNVPTSPEAGGMQIGKGYGYFRTLAKELDLSLSPLSGFAKGLCYAIDGQLISPEKWPEHPLNALNSKEKHLAPSSLYFHYLKQLPKLTIPSDWNKPEFSALDISMRNMLNKQGPSAQAMSFMNANVNANNLDVLSGADAIHAFTQAMLGGRGADRVSGGNSQFIQSLTDKVKGSIALKKAVISINASDKQVSIQCSDGSKYQAAHCICTIPFSVLRNISINAPLPAHQQEAIATLNYTAITQVHFDVLDDSWLSDGMSANMWANEGFGRIFASQDTKGRVRHLVSWNNGDAAISLDKKSAKDAIASVEQAMYRVRPALKGKIKPVNITSWGNDPYALGAYASFGPGQVQKFAGRTSDSAGNLHFAGEHTNHEYSGMESALVSGLIAAGKVS